MKIKDIMRRDFVRFNSNDSLPHVLAELSKNKFSSAPVFDDGELVGIVGTRSIAKYLCKPEFSSVWKDGASPVLAKMRKLNAGQLSAKPMVALKADQEISSASGILSSSEGCIPVFAGKRVVGIIRSEDTLRFFTTAFARGAHRESQPPASLMKADEGMVDTAIDEVLAIVRRDKLTTPAKVAAEMGISKKSVEKLAETLSRHHIIKMEYSFLSGAKLRMIGHDQG